jgi:CelD/BcsL family acetyltransferase involved in cellulose biosynthesis
MSISLANADLSRFIERQAPGVWPSLQTWLDTVPRIYGYRVIPLIATNNEACVSGFLPLCLIKSPLTGRRLVALPFTDICPFLAEDGASAHKLIDEAVELARQHKVKYLELRTGANEVLASRPDLVQGNLYVRWLLPLHDDPASVWASLRKPVQHQIKKSQKLGVQVRVASQREDLEHYYRLHFLTRTRKHGMPSQPRRYFYDLWDAFAADGRMQLLLADYQGAAIAGMILLASGTTMRYAYGASDEQYLQLAPNNLLMWTSIKMGCEQGYQTFDMGRTARDNEGLMEYKRRWGATEEDLPYFYYPRVAGLASTPESGRLFRVLTSCWKRLPAAVASTAGGYLYKHLG